MQCTLYVFICMGACLTVVQSAFIRGSRSLAGKLAIYLYLTSISSSTYASKSLFPHDAMLRHVIAFRESCLFLLFNFVISPQIP